MATKVTRYADISEDDLETSIDADHGTITNVLFLTVHKHGNHTVYTVVSNQGV